MSSAPQLPSALDILGFGLVLPQARVGIDSLFELERDNIELQLSPLTPRFRERLIDQLGIRSVATFTTEASSTTGCQAADRALTRAGTSITDLALVLDFSTYAVDAPGIWSLAHEVQGQLGAHHALALSTRGSGCAGLHAALVVASSLLSSHPSWQTALLVAADRAPDRARSCLPISFMADAASAMVVARAGTHPRPLGTIRSVELLQNGRFASTITAQAHPARMVVDAGLFERKILPLHFVMLHRVLTRALEQVVATTADLGALVYPNTTALDRSSIARALGLSESMLAGPGPEHLGHAFANDLLINAEPLLVAPAGPRQRLSAWLAAGSGFCWGAAIVELGYANAVG